VSGSTVGKSEHSGRGTVATYHAKTLAQNDLHSVRYSSRNLMRKRHGRGDALFLLEQEEDPFRQRNNDLAVEL
jgi:hypothetical protein